MSEGSHCAQAVEGSPIKPSQAARDERGRVNLDELSDADLDYGTDERGLASLRRRLKRAIYTYEGQDRPPEPSGPFAILLTCLVCAHMTGLISKESSVKVPLLRPKIRERD